MANTKIHFLCSAVPTDYITVQETERLNENFIHIVIKEEGTPVDAEILLDKSTAIKFAKTLRTEINKITAREEGNNEL